MPAQVLTPSAVGFYDTGVLGAGASKTAAVQTNDGDTSYMSYAAANKVETFVMQQTPLNPYAIVISSYVASYVEKYVGASLNATFKHRARYNSTDSDVQWWTSTSGSLTSNTYTTDSDTLATAPDGSAWTPTSANNTQLGSNMNAYTSGEVRVTQIFATVTFLAGPGGQMFMLWCVPLLLAQIGAGIGLEHVDGIARELYRQSGGIHRVLPDERRELLSDLRAWTRPARVFPWGTV